MNIHIINWLDTTFVCICIKNHCTWADASCLAMENKPCKTLSWLLFVLWTVGIIIPSAWSRAFDTVLLSMISVVHGQLWHENIK
jgi:hypothetical protein